MYTLGDIRYGDTVARENAASSFEFSWKFNSHLNNVRSHACTMYCIPCGVELSWAGPSCKREGTQQHKQNARPFNPLGCRMATVCPSAHKFWTSQLIVFTFSMNIMPLDRRFSTSKSQAVVKCASSCCHMLLEERIVIEYRHIWTSRLYEISR
jgi:hypothetical protein